MTVKVRNIEAPNPGVTPEVPAKPKKPLYCIAYTYREPIAGSNPPRKRWVSSKLYVHADDAGEARLIFLRSEDPRTMREIHITGVAIALGFFVEDKHGEVLSAD